MAKAIKSETAVSQSEEFDFEDFKFNKIDDFKLYNKHVREFNRTVEDDHKKMRIKVPDESFHPKRKIKFQRFDQPENVLKVWVRNKDIDWKGQLKPGCTYDLPIPVIRFLNRLAVPLFAEVPVIEDGRQVGTETKQVGERPRFSCQEIYED